MWEASNNEVIDGVVGKLQFDFFISSAVGHGSTSLNSFDAALFVAGFGNFNLVKVSSILPRNSCKVDNVELHPGTLLHTAYAAFTSEGQGDIISACLAVGIPQSPEDHIGVIMEAGGLGELSLRRDAAKAMVVEAMALRGIPLDEIVTEGVEAQVQDCTTVFAGIGLMPRPRKDESKSG